jgi:hypothetical protein
MAHFYQIERVTSFGEPPSCSQGQSTTDRGEYCAFTISPGTGMVAANFACFCPTNRVLRNVALNSFGFIGIEAKRKPAVITAWTTPFDVVRLARDWLPQIDQIAQPFEHCRPASPIC